MDKSIITTEREARDVKSVTCVSDVTSVNCVTCVKNDTPMEIQMSNETKMTLADLQALVLSQAEIIKALQTATAPKVTVSSREMTDDDAKRLIIGDLATTKHKEAAKILNLTYGQVYSARLEFTFKAVHKAIKTEGKTNPWVK